MNELLTHDALTRILGGQTVLGVVGLAYVYQKFKSFERAAHDAKKGRELSEAALKRIDELKVTCEKLRESLSGIEKIILLASKDHDHLVEKYEDLKLSIGKKNESSHS